MGIQKAKASGNETTKSELLESIKKKKHSKTWLAVLAAVKNPGIEIIDMKAVLK